jgi:Zn-dependent protease
VPPLSLQEFLFRLFALLVVAAAHGFAVAAIARLLGDRGPGYDGRLTLNPFAHLDLLGALGLLIYQLGWTKPVIIDPTQLRGARWGLVIVALGGLIGVLLLALAFWHARRPVFLISDSAVLVSLLGEVADMALWFAPLNMLPIPPLACGLLLQAATPKLHRVLSANWILLALLLAITFVSGLPGEVLQPAHDYLREALGLSV